MDSLVAEFKLHHFSVIDLLDDEEDLAKEHEIYDMQDEEVQQLSLRLGKLVASADLSQHKMAFNRLKHLEKGLSSISNSIPTSSVYDDVCLLQQLEVQLSEFKKEYSDILHNTHALDIEDSSDLGQLLASLNKHLFDTGLEIRKQLRACSSLSSTPSDSKDVRLSKLDVPTFDGQILSWKTFWEQFLVSVHDI